MKVRTISKITASVSLVLHGKLLDIVCRSCSRYNPSTSPPVEPPTLSDIYNFIHGVAWRIQLEPECLIVTLIYVDRIIQLYSLDILEKMVNSWDIAILACMSLASCLWDDISASPRSFAIAAMRETGRNEYSAKDIISGHWLLIDNPYIQLNVTSQDYRKYYYNLEKIWTRIGLTQSPTLQPIPLHPTAILGLQLPEEWHIELALIGDLARKWLHKGWNNTSLTLIYRSIFNDKILHKSDTLYVGYCDMSAGIGSIHPDETHELHNKI